MSNDEKISIMFSTIAGSFSLVDFKTILDIILIILSILNILIILMFKLKAYLKDKKLDKDELKDLSNDFKSLKEKIEEGEDLCKTISKKSKN